MAVIGGFPQAQAPQQDGGGPGAGQRGDRSAQREARLVESQDPEKERPGDCRQRPDKPPTPCAGKRNAKRWPAKESGRVAVRSDARSKTHHAGQRDESRNPDRSGDLRSKSDRIGSHLSWHPSVQSSVAQPLRARIDRRIRLSRPDGRLSPVWPSVWIRQRPSARAAHTAGCRRGGSNRPRSGYRSATAG